jgi:hypothetical protein
MRRAIALVVLWCVGWTVAPAGSAASFGVQPAASAPAAEPSLERIEEFLKNAKIVDAKPIGKGVTHPWRLTLTDGTLTHDAAFQSVDRQSENVRFRDGRRERLFRDYFGYNIAAYRLARLLGCDDLVPASVERRWRGQSGAITWWVNKKWDEDERLKAGVEAPDKTAWERQVYRARTFTALVEDTDRNLGNQLVTEDFKLWMIDFTRAFRMSEELDKPDYLRRIDRRLFDRLQAVTRAEIAKAVKPYVDGDRVAALDARRAALLKHFARIAEERGADTVFF